MPDGGQSETRTVQEFSAGVFAKQSWFAKRTTTRFVAAACETLWRERQSVLGPDNLPTAFLVPCLGKQPDSPDEADHVAGGVSPVTVWLRRLEAGDAQAAQPLYQHFCVRLQELARRRIPANVRSVYDHDDASASAFHSLFLGIREQRYQLRDRTDIWRLLLTIAERKIAHRIRDEMRDKRDMRRVVYETVFLRLPNEQGDGALAGMDSLTGREPTPEFAAEVSDTCDALLAALPDDKSRQIALLKLERHTSDEIAAKLSCSRRTVQRKLLVIRRTWQHASGIEISNDELSQNSDEQA